MTTVTLRYVLGLDPIPGKSARLLSLRARTAQAPLRNKFSYADATVLDKVGGDRVKGVISGEGIVTTLSVSGSRKTLSQGVGIRYTTADFFRVFNVPIVRGRRWTPKESRNAAPVTVISEGMASYLFQNGAAAIGQHLRIGHTLYTVIGVTGPWNPQPRYYDLDGPAGAFGGGGDQLYMPITAIQYAPDNAMVARACPGNSVLALTPPPALLGSQCAWLSVWYLVRTRQDAAGLARALKAQLPRWLPARRAENLRLMNVQQILAKADIVPGAVRLYAMLGLAFLILCVINASGMQVSRALRATSQVGIRRALGASRSDIVKQYLCDALLVSGIGGLLGIGLTFAGLYAVRHLPGVYYADLARMNGAMFALMIAVVCACAVLVGIVPAWLVSRADPALVIKAPE